MNPMTNTRHKMEIVLKERRNGKPRELCAKAASVPLRKITHWYNEGKQGIGSDNIYFYKSLKKIEKDLNEKLKYEDEIREYQSAINVNKRINFLNYIKKGQTRENASKHSQIKLKLITKWDSLGRKGIKPFKAFHEDYIKAREIATKNEAKEKEKLKRETINHIKNGKSLNQAAKLVRNGKHEKTIINWYNAGKRGNKNHVKFYNDCEKYLKPTINTDIFAPLPKEWRDHFKKLPMNKTGIAWVNRGGNNWIYTRQVNTKTISISDPNIRTLHKKIIKQGQIWGIRDMSLARPIITTNKFPTSKPPKKNKVKVEYKRLNEQEFQATAKGTIENNQFKSILTKLEFFTPDIQKTETKRVNGKTEILLILKIKITLIDKFEAKIKSMGWEIMEI